MPPVFTNPSWNHQDQLGRAGQNCAMKIMMLTITALACLLLCAGCIFTTDYPKDWPEQSAAGERNDCPDIAGTYYDTGQLASDGTDISLAESLSVPMPASGLISISHEGDDAIMIAAPVPDGEEKQRVVLSRGSGDYKCDEGRLWISEAEWLDPDGGIAAIVVRIKVNMGISKTMNGSLLAEMHGAGGGVTLLFGIVPIPGAVKGINYALWQPISLP